jgi:hypothetical protein
VAALAVALAVLVAAAAPGRAAPAGCASCTPGCPMHARKVGCHHAKAPSCHGAAGGLRSACAARHDPATGAATEVRGVMPPPAVAGASASRDRIAVATPRLPARALPEPPTGPPRSLVRVA